MPPKRDSSLLRGEAHSGLGNDMKNSLLCALAMLGVALCATTATAADGASIVESMEEARAQEEEVSERDKYLLEHYVAERKHDIYAPDGRYVDTIVELESPPDPRAPASTDLSQGPDQ